MPPAPHYVTVFDIGQVGFRSLVWWVLAGAIALLAVSGGWQAWRDRKNPEALRKTALVALCLLLFCGVILVAQLASLARFYDLQAGLRSGRYNVVEGVVTNFRFGKIERFDVGKVEFTYSRSDLSSMFNTTTAGGLPDIKNRHVRITYDGNDIMRLEIADGAPGS